MSTLSGEWTHAKWDYWIREVFARGVLTNDEFALADHSMISGMIGGAATLHVRDIQHQVRLSFAGLQRKIATELAVELSLQIAEQPLDDTPNLRQAKRRERAVAKARTRLVTSPVMQLLQDYGALAAVDDPLQAVSEPKLLDG